MPESAMVHRTPIVILSASERPSSFFTLDKIDEGPSLSLMMTTPR